MRKFLTLLIVSAVCFSTPSLKANSILPVPVRTTASEIIQPVDVVVTISGSFTSKRSGCTKFGFSCLNFDVTLNFRSSEGPVTKLHLNMVSPGMLEISSLYPESLPSDVMEVESDVTVGPQICEQLGYSSIVLRKGMYKCSKDKFGNLVVTIACDAKR